MAEPEVRIAAGDRGFEERVQRLADRVHSRFRYHSIELPDGSVLPGLQTGGTSALAARSFRTARRTFAASASSTSARGMAGSVSNASAAAPKWSRSIASRSTRFIEAKELIGSKVEYLTLDVNELSARRLGRFDIVLFFGVLYHLRHPLLGLEKAVELSTDLVLIESFVIQREDRARSRPSWSSTSAPSLAGRSTTGAGRLPSQV